MDVVVENLTKSFENQKAVDSISFKAKRGEILGFLGPNGAGKTTTMKIMAGLLTPDFGNITFGDYSIWKQAGKIKNIIGYLPERNPLYDEMNVIDFLFFISKLHNIPKYKITSRVLDMIRLCGLDNDKHKQIGELSKGFRQRVGIAQAIIHNPDFIILDEPTNGLDPNQIVEIRNLIKQIAQERTVILSTHILPEVQATCEYIYMVEKGKMVFSGTVDEFDNYILPTTIRVTLLAHPTVEELTMIPGLVAAQHLGEMDYRLQFADARNMVDEIIETCGIHNWRLSQIYMEKSSLDVVFAELSKK